MSTYGSFIGRVCLVFGFLEIYCNGNSIRILNRFHGHDYTGTKIIDPPSDGRLQKNIYFDSSEDEIEHSNLSIHLPLDGLKKDTEESSSSWKIPLEYSSNSIDKDSERNNSESMLMTTFKDFFLNDLFPTQTDNGNKFSFERNGIDGLENFCVDNAHALCLGRLYGTDSTREFALRLQSRGQMKSNEYGGLPNIVEVRKNAEYFSIQCDHNHTNTLCMNDSDWYATGHINSNFHPGRLFYTELFLKEHNYIAEVLGNQNPTWDDDQIFQVARIMMIHLFTKIIVEEYLPSALRKKYKMNYFRYYDPNELRKIQYHIHTNPFFLEFHNFYCSWISLVTGNIEFESGEMRRFNEFLWKPSEYKTIGVEKFLRAFYRTNVTGSEAPSIPKDFISISREFILNRSLRSLKSMIDTGRSLHQFRSYNVYREYLDLPPLQSFDDFHISPEIRKALQEFYETVNDVDFFVGIALEQCSNHGKVSLS